MDRMVVTPIPDMQTRPANVPSVPPVRSKPLLIQARMDLCPIKESAKILGKKWYLVIIHRLLGKKMGFNELKEAVGDISAKILSQALQDLAEKKIIERRMASESPVRVEYKLTPQGEDLNRVLVELYDWGKRWAICKDGRPAYPTPERFRSTRGAASAPSAATVPAPTATTPSVQPGPN